MNIPLSEIPEAVYEMTGKRPCRATVYNWIKAGCNGVKLRVAGVTTFKFTRRSWIRKFMNLRGAESSVAQVSEQLHLANKLARESAARREKRHQFKPRNIHK